MQSINPKELIKNNNESILILDIRHSNSFKDWRILGYRTIFSDKENMASIFGYRIYEEFRIPRNLVVKYILKYALSNPIDTIGAMVMNLFIRWFPLDKKSSIFSNGTWKITISSKEAI